MVNKQGEKDEDILSPKTNMLCRLLDLITSPLSILSTYFRFCILNSSRQLQGVVLNGAFLDVLVSSAQQREFCLLHVARYLYLMVDFILNLQLMILILFQNKTSVEISHLNDTGQLKTFLQSRLSLSTPF